MTPEQLENKKLRARNDILDLSETVEELEATKIGLSWLEEVAAMEERQRIKAKIKTLNPIELKTPMGVIVAVNDILDDPA